MPTHNPLPENIERHRALWIQDGNIVLLVENTAFRVHRSTLSRHSDVFRDMFSLPQSATPGETFGGCPAVRIPDESSKNFAVVLSVVYDGGISFYNHNIPLPFEVVVAALLVATKFQFGDIRREALARLRANYPSDIPTLKEIMNRHHGEPYGLPRGVTGFSVNNAPIMVAIACNLELFDLLPSALYICAQLDIEELFQIVRNGTSRGAEHFLLQHLELCMRFRTDLLRHYDRIFAPIAMAEVSDRCIAPPSGLDMYPTRCALTYPRILFSIAHAGETRASTHPLWDIASILREWDSDVFSPEPSERDGLCKCCSFELSEEIAEAQDYIWNALYDQYGPAPSPNISP